VDQKTKVRENRARRALERQWPGLRLKKTRRRDPLAADYGTFKVVNATGQGHWMFSKGHWKMTLHEIEERLGIRDEKEDS